MADNNEEKKNSTIPDKISSISDDEAASEIDFGSFLAGGDNSALFEGFHADIEKTGKDLSDELQSLYDNIVASGPQTAVPKPLDVIMGEEEEQPEERSKPLDDMWMSPEEYIDMPPKAKVTVEEAPELETSNKVESQKEDIFELISKFKSDTDSEHGFDEILREIEENTGITPLTADYITSAAQEPAEAEDNATFHEKLDEYLNGEYKPIAKKNADFPDEIDFEDLDGESDGTSSSGFSGGEGIQIEDISSDIPSDGEVKSAASDKNVKKKKKKLKPKEIVRRCVLTLSIITIIVSSAVLVEQYVYEPWKFKKQQAQLTDIVDNSPVKGDPGDVVDSELSGKYPGVKFPEGMLKKYAQLYAANNDLAGWISIPGFDINLPIAKGADNDYYLHRDIYGKSTMYGVPFFDYRMTNLTDLHRNTVVYGHNMRHDDLIFGLFENYREISGFEQAPVVECNTIYGDHTWFVYAVFMTNSTPSGDNGYQFPYNFIDCSGTKFKSFVEEIDKRKFYTTGVDIVETDRILTLSTCCYDFDDARLVVVCREKRANESVNVDTSKASVNTNPKYPQAWYDANNKTNPYANDSRW